MQQSRSEQAPKRRVRDLNRRPVRADGEYVLYRMVAARWNFSLDRAVDLARELDRPLIVLEALRVDYPWGSERFHRFVFEGMGDNARAFRGTEVLYNERLDATSRNATIPTLTPRAGSRLTCTSATSLGARSLRGDRRAQSITLNRDRPRLALGLKRGHVHRPDGSGKRKRLPFQFGIDDVAKLMPPPR